MKRTNQLYRAALLLLALTQATACTRDDDFITPGNDSTDASATLLAITVADGGYTGSPQTSTGKAAGTDAPATRAKENGYATEFTKGDRIGLYVRVTDGNGSVKLLHENLCLTYNGTDWELPAGVKLKYDATTAYFAYYPWQSSKPAVTDISASTAEEFFGGLIANWAPDRVQSTYTQYTASDLMVATGEITGNTSIDGFALYFTMKHQMVLNILRVPTTRCTYSETISDVGTTGKDYRLYSGLNVRGWKVNSYMTRLLYNPLYPASLSGAYYTAAFEERTFDIRVSNSANTYNTVTMDGGAETDTDRPLRVGDFYMKDGTVLPFDAFPGGMPDNVKADCLGVVFWVGENNGAHWTRTSRKKGDHLLMRDHPECTRGMVVALKDASAGAEWATGSGASESLYNWAYDFVGFNSEEEADWSLIEVSYGYGYRYIHLMELYGAHHPGTTFPAYNRITAYAAANPAPESSSGWSFPGDRELAMMCYGLAKDYSARLATRRDLLNEQFTKAGGETFAESIYWSSTDLTLNSWGIDFAGTTTYGDHPKTEKHRVRAVLAF